MNSSPQSNIISFIVRIVIFALPILTIVAALEWMLWRIGDSLPVTQVLARQQREADTLYGRSYFSQQFNVYKIAGIRLRKPTILILGSSRVMQFRDLMFAPLQDEFYNAGGILQNAYDLQAFTNMVTDGKIPTPRILIVGIDPWWIKKGYGENSWLGDQDEAYNPVAHISVIRRILRSGRSVLGLITDYQLPNRTSGGQHLLGSLAIRNGSGFRVDGSKRPPLKVFLDYAKNPRFVDRESPPVIQRILTHSSPFNLPAVVDEKLVARVIDSLQALKSRKIEVYAFFPPFAEESLVALDKDNALSPWWHYYKERLPNLLRDRGIELISISSPADLGLDDRYMLDGFHPGEVFIAHATERLVALASSTSPLLKLVDLSLIDHRVKNAAMPLSLSTSASLTDQ